MGAGSLLEMVERVSLGLKCRGKKMPESFSMSYQKQKQQGNLHYQEGCTEVEKASSLAHVMKDVGAKF